MPARFLHILFSNYLSSNAEVGKLFCKGLDRIHILGFCRLHKISITYSFLLQLIKNVKCETILAEELYINR